MKVWITGLIVVLAGMFALIGLSSQWAFDSCVQTKSESGVQVDSISVLDQPIGFYAISPAVQYSFPDKLRSKRRAVSAKPESTLVSSLVLCALTAVLVDFFYKAFLLAPRARRDMGICNFTQFVPHFGSSCRIFSLQI